MSYYHGFISSRRANSLLNQRLDGSFLIRDSQSQPGNFVLSAKYVGRMYHVLIFQEDGKYVLDSAGEAEEEGNVKFSSLDELVLFLTGHNLKVAEDEVQLTTPCPCADNSTRISSNSVSRVGDGDDSDVMTDVFAMLFGTRCVVICVAHSTAAMDGQQESQGPSYWVAIVKDLEQKGYYIRIVDKKERIMAREKKVGKHFQYDMPNDLLMTFLSEHGITCVGFKDTQEKDRFLHQIDRVVKLEQERSIKLRGRKDSEATAKKKPTEISHRIKASDFDVDNMSPEWQYLFDEAGVTEEMLKTKSSLQFILDTVYEIGPPQKLPNVVSGGTEGDPDKAALERQQALDLDANLKRASLHASMLSKQLVQQSLKEAPTPALREHVCSHLALCERFKDNLVIKHSMMALGPENGRCLCGNCSSGKQSLQVAGNPPQQFTLPIGWCQFMHSSQSHALAQHISGRWHIAYCCVAASRVAGIMRTGQLEHSLATGETAVSPDIQCACDISSISPHSYHDKVSGAYYQVMTVFQVLLQPGTYSVHMVESRAQDAMATKPIQLKWHAKERTYIVHSLWISMEQADQN